MAGESDEAAASREGTAKNLSTWALMTRVVIGEYQDEDVRSQWLAFQRGLAQKLDATSERGEKVPLRVLLATYVSGDEGSADMWGENVERLTGNAAGDQFDFAFFHFDGDNSVYQRRSWYTKPIIKIRHVGAGCQPMFWRMLNVSFVQSYDYVWLCDGDIHMGFFSWDIYRSMLRKLRPLVSQPAVVPAVPGRLGSRVMQVNMRADRDAGEDPVLVHEARRTEVMTPVLSTRLWPAFQARLAGSDLHQAWNLDFAWDLPALASKAACNRTGISIVDAAPVRHMDFKAMTSSTGQLAHCITGIEMGSGASLAQNERPLERAELELLAEGLAGHCGGAGDLLAELRGRVVTQAHDELLRAAPERRKWSRSMLAS